MKNITKRLLSLRKDHSRRSFASMLGVAEGTLRAYEAGTSSPNIQTLERVCKKLRISHRWLLLGEGPVYIEGDNEEIAQTKPLDGDTQRLEAKVAELEKKFTELQEETAKAYKLATELMKPDTDILQKQKPQKVEHAPARQTYSEPNAEEKL